MSSTLLICESLLKIDKYVLDYNTTWSKTSMVNGQSQTSVTEIFNKKKYI